jgi:hypothetical protein
VSASRGSTETPSPDATMLRTVSSEFVRAVGRPWRLSSGHGVEHLVAEAVADVEQDRVLAGQLVGPHRLALGPLVLARHDDLERLLVQEHGRHARRRERQRDDRRVEPAALELGLERLGHVLLELERHLRRELAEHRHEVRGSGTGATV